MPAASAFSIDSWWKRKRGNSGASPTVPFWAVAVLRGQLVIAYFYAGVAKLNADWLLDAVPVRWFMNRPEVLAPFQGLLPSTLLDWFEQLVRSTGFAYFISYTGALFDLTIGFLLLIPRTRLAAFMLMILFHLTNHMLIFDDIGWFPILGIVSSTIFLSPDWPQRLLARLKRSGSHGRKRTGIRAKDGRHPGGTGASDRRRPEWLGSPVRSGKRIAWGAGCALVWLAFQSRTTPALFHCPLRPKRKVRFTYEGLSFSWRLKTDTRHGIPPRMTIHDDAIVSEISNGKFQIDWNEWRGEQVLYRETEPKNTDWSLCPNL